MRAQEAHGQIGVEALEGPNGFPPTQLPPPSSARSVSFKCDAYVICMNGLQRKPDSIIHMYDRQFGKSLHKPTKISKKGTLRPPPSCANGGNHSGSGFGRGAFRGDH